MNRIGYELMNQNRIDDAIKIFQLNISEYPDAWNPYTSLAEAYEREGNTDQAITYYEKALKLNPEEKRIQKKLNDLKEK